MVHTTIDPTLAHTWVSHSVDTGHGRVKGLYKKKALKKEISDTQRNI